MGKILSCIKIKDKGQITLPREIQEFLGIKEGDNIIIILKDKELILKSGNID